MAPEVVGTGDRIGRGGTIVGRTSTELGVTIRSGPAIRTRLLFIGTQTRTNASVEDSIAAVQAAGRHQCTREVGRRAGMLDCRRGPLGPWMFLGPRPVPR